MKRFLAGCVLAAPFLCFAGQDGRYCTIPTLFPGIPVRVSVDNINEPFCGTALIDGHFRKLSEITSRQVQGPILCVNTSSCQRTVQYFPLGDSRQAPYVIIFSGPNSAAGA